MQPTLVETIDKNLDVPQKKTKKKQFDKCLMMHFHNWILW